MNTIAIERLLIELNVNMVRLITVLNTCDHCHGSGINPLQDARNCKKPCVICQGSGKKNSKVNP